MLVLTGAEVWRLADPDLLLDALAEGFRRLTAGEVAAPDRIGITVPAGLMLTMPAHSPGMPLGVKVVTVFDQNTAVPTHQALVLLFDADTGGPLAVIDGAAVTALRTAGAAILAARLLARPGARTALVIGGGVQGAAHLALLDRLGPLERVLVASVHDAQAHGLAAQHGAQVVPWTELANGVAAADLVFCATSAAEPVLDPAWVRPGAHVSSVGYAPPRGELPPALAAAALASGVLAVETRRAFAPPPVGCAELAGLDAAAAVELGELVSGSHPGRITSEQLTLYKAMGHAVEDLVTADLVYRRARSAT